MRIHIIAMGGAVMHNLSIALHLAGHQVTGSDDEIYNPAKDKLESYHLLPPFGWHPDQIDASIDLVIVGMHAKKDNPELLKAIALNLKVVSYPEYIGLHAQNKKRIVVAGSHGKTSTTSMIMHILKACGVDYDYLVGAPLEGFDLMIKLSDAPLMIIEGDEYLSAPTDPKPKILHYHPQITIITGIAWDHINVFPTHEDYIHVFADYIQSLPSGAKVYHFGKDEELNHLVHKTPRRDISFSDYVAYPHKIKDSTAYLLHAEHEFQIQVFGQHNFENIQAAIRVCSDLGIEETASLQALMSFKGAAKRLQPLFISPDTKIYLDFAHAPSKVKATVKAMRSQFPQFRLICLVELHTYSSLNKDFLPQYAHVLDEADEAIVFFNKHTLEIKRMPDLDIDFVKAAFAKTNLKVFTQNDQLEGYLDKIDKKRTVILFMSSGTFNGVNIKAWALN